MPPSTTLAVASEVKFADGIPASVDDLDGCMLAVEFDWAVLLSVKMAMQTINRVHDIIVTEWFFLGRWC